MARALRSQRRGRGFDSHHLHESHSFVILQKGFNIIRHIQIMKQIMKQIMNIEFQFRIESANCLNFVRGSLNVS